MTIYEKIGTGLIFLSIAMLLFGINIFTYQGDFYQLVSQLGMYCFSLWLPTLIIGLVLILSKINKR